MNEPSEISLLAVSEMPFWAYLLSAYLGLSLLKIRTFLEHQAHEKARGRTVIIEDRGPLALLFLNGVVFGGYAVLSPMTYGVWGMASGAFSVVWIRRPIGRAPIAAS